ncbi:MAG: hypothetical protein AAGA54_12505 [Myxococcota bacterium]
MIRSTLLLLAATVCACTGPAVPLGTDGTGDASSSSGTPTSTATDATTDAPDVSTTSTSSTTSTGASPPGTTTFETTRGITTDDGESADTGASISVPPDAGRVVIECSEFDQDCDEGEKCVPWANDGGDAYNAAHCVPVPDNPRAVGESCAIEDFATSGFDDCAVGAGCEPSEPGGLVGVCVPFCDVYSPAGCSDPAQVCVLGDVGLFNVCRDVCDPKAPMPCPNAQTCTAFDDDFICLP